MLAVWGMIGIVIDTNFLIDHLEWLKLLLILLEQESNIKIHVPFIVIQELDGLRRKNVTDFLMTRSQIIKLKEISRWKGNNDDLILENCVKLEFPVKVLLTNDINLCLKASVYSIKTVSRPLLDVNVFYLQLKQLLTNDVELGKLKVLQEMEIDVDPRPRSEVSQEDLQSQNHFKNLDYILNDLITLVENSLNPLFKEYLQVVYGENSQYLKNWPWNIKELFQILVDHEFIIKINLDLLKSSKSQLRNMGKDLQRCRENHKNLVTIGDLLVFIKDLQVMFQQLPSDLVESIRELEIIETRAKRELL